MKKFNEKVEILILKSTPKDTINDIFNNIINSCIPNFKKIGIDIEMQNNYDLEIEEMEEFFLLVGNINYSSDEKVDLNSLIYELS